MVDYKIKPEDLGLWHQFEVPAKAEKTMALGMKFQRKSNDFNEKAEKHRANAIKAEKKAKELEAKAGKLKAKAQAINWTLFQRFKAKVQKMKKSDSKKHPKHK
jgi:regulator of protease activity HflC (stomatin/prohibitin superfamily)